MLGPRTMLIVPLLILVSTLLCTQTSTHGSSAVARTSSPMTNEDVVRMSKIGFGNDLIEAKIQQSTAVDFKLEVDDLSRLKAAGVSQDVSSAMPKRSIAHSEPTEDVRPMPPGRDSPTLGR
jgi:hypothetical protein